MRTDLDTTDDTDTGTTPGATEAIHRRRWTILAVLCLSLFVIVVDNTIVNVALPTISRELGASTSQLQWIVDAYSLVFAGLLLAAGSLGDRFGRKGALQLGMVTFAPVLGAGRPGRQPRAAHRRPRRHGHRRRADLPGHPGHPHQRLHRPVGAGQGHRRLGRRHRSGRGARAAHRRLDPGALLLGRDLPRQRAHRGGGAAARTGLRPDLAGPRRPATRSRRLRAVDRRRGRAGVGHDRGADLRLDLADDPGRLRRSASWCW